MTRHCQPSTINSERNGEDGFTLIEILVTLCVVALLAGAMSASLTHFARMRDITRAVTVQQELDAAMDYLQGLIENSQGLPLLGQGLTHLPLIGSAHDLQFVSQVRVTSERYAIRDVELLLRKDPNGLSLIEMHNLRRVTGERGESGFVVLQDVISMDLSYLSPQETGEARWQDEWRSERIPPAIKIRLQIHRNGRVADAERTAFLDR